VATCGADRAPGDEHARPRQEAVRHAVAHTPVRASCIANGREASIDHGPHQRRGADRHQGQRDSFEIADVHFRQHHMDVTIDQARHQRATLAVDDIGVGCLDRFRRDFPDQIAFDQHRNPALQRIGIRIEQVGILEQDLRHPKILLLRPRPAAQAPAASA
jgi:hypothetical protein